MHQTLYYPAKDAETRETFTVDWSRHLAAEEVIQTSTWTVVGHLDPEAEGEDIPSGKTWVRLGPDPAAADVVVLTNTITTSAAGLYVQTLTLGLAEPISLEFAKQRLAVTSDHRDAEIVHLIAAARWHVEDYTGLILTRRTVVETLDAFGRVIALDAWPVTALESITYLDTDLVEQTVPGPRLLTGKRPARIIPAAGQPWPNAAIPAEIAITLTAGYDHTLPPGADGAIPAPLLQAMLLLIGHWLENRETVVVGAVATDLPHGWMALAHPYRRLF